MRMNAFYCMVSLCLVYNSVRMFGQVMERWSIIPAESSMRDSQQRFFRMENNADSGSSHDPFYLFGPMMKDEMKNDPDKNGYNTISDDSECSGDVCLAWEREYAYGLAPAADAAYDIATDENGNIYVTGSSTASPYGSEFCTIKYDKNGNQIWVERFGKGQCQTAGATDIAIGPSGNVCVTGCCIRSEETGFDILTVQYNPDGEQQWFSFYNSPSNGQESSSDIVVDSSGNVYITGLTESPASGRNFLTIRYDPTGNEQWVEQYNGTGNGKDQAQYIAVDSQRGIIVGGMSTGVESGLDFTVIHYSPEGTEQQVVTYDGPNQWHDELTGMTIDKQGNVYMAGAAGGKDNRYDYILVKFNPQGEQEWEKVHEVNTQGYNYTDVAVDRNGHSYMPIQVMDENYHTSLSLFAYDGSGSPLWSSNFKTIPCSPQRVILDSDGNIITIGNYHEVGSDCDYVTVKYTSSGELQWYKQYGHSAQDFDRPMGAVTDAYGNVVITGYSRASDGAFDYATVRYSSSGDEQWIVRYNGPGDTQDEACGMAMDNNSNVYVLGVSLGSGTNDDYLVIKYTPDGDQVWAVRYNGPGNGPDVPEEIITDSQDYIYVSGTSLGLGIVNEYATIKYDAEGNELWASRYACTSERPGKVAAMAVDTSGNVYIACNSDGANSQTDFTVIKYNTSGTELWAFHSNNPDGKHACLYVADMALDNSGNLYFTGESSLPGGDDNMTTIKYNSEGTEQWVVYYDSPVENNEWYDRAAEIGVDRSGNIYILGASDGMDSGSDLTLVKYDSSGHEKWVRRYDGPAHDWEFPYSLEIDGSANVYIAGQSRGLNQQDDFVTVKYDSSGNEMWTARYDSPESYRDAISDLVLDNQGNVYVSGSTSGLPSSYLVMLKYTKDGEQEWIAKFDSQIGLCGAEVDKNGNVYVAGENWGLGWVVISAMKFIQTGTGIDKLYKNAVPVSFSLYPNFPNPFNSETTFIYQIPEPELVSLKIVNLKGECVRDLISRMNDPGNYEVKWDGRNDSGLPMPTGVYFYILKTNNHMISRKMILLQ